MLIPQPRIGVGERRRPDFVLFVPLHYWRYRWYAVQLGKGHSNPKDDEARDAHIAEQGYTIIKLKSETPGYYEEVRSLVERADIEMKQAESDPWSIAQR